MIYDIGAHKLKHNPFDSCKTHALDRTALKQSAFQQAYVSHILE